jgi:hypothetical protein
LMDPQKNILKLSFAIADPRTEEAAVEMQWLFAVID